MKRQVLHPIPWLVAGALLAAALGPAPAEAQRQVSDRIYLKGRGEPLPAVEITAESIDGIETRGPDLAATQVERIEYADAPFAFKEAHRMRQLGRYDEAIVLYKSALRAPEGTVRRFWLEPNCRYYIALCHLEAGELDEAEAAFKELLGKHPKTRFLPDALLAQGRVQYDKKNYDEAVRRFDDLARRADAEKWAEWKYRAYLWKGRALLAADQHAQALDAVAKIVGQPEAQKYEDVYTQARTVEARVYQLKGEFDRAIRLVSRLIDDIAPAVAREVQSGTESAMQRTEAQCKNTLGYCYMAKAEKAADEAAKKKFLKDARLAFLWTVVLYPNLTDERIEALKNAAECFEKLGDRRRASELRNELEELQRSLGPQG
ncbi:MAG: tetratricopeptide repeat protein [bacterium]